MFINSLQVNVVSFCNEGLAEYLTFRIQPFKNSIKLKIYTVWTNHEHEAILIRHKVFNGYM